MSHYQGSKSSNFDLISDLFALHKTPFSDFQCIEKHIFSGISDYFRLVQIFSHRRSHTPAPPMYQFTIESYNLNVQKCKTLYPLLFFRCTWCPWASYCIRYHTDLCQTQLDSSVLRWWQPNHQLRRRDERPLQPPMVSCPGLHSPGEVPADQPQGKQ